SLLGDALAHAALPGVCLAFLVSGSKAPLPILFGALLSGLAGALLVIVLRRTTKLQEDAAIGIVLSVFFGFGIVLLTRIQKLPGGNQSGLDKFLFGQAATLLPADIARMSGLGLAALAVVLLLYKELKLLAFDRAFGESAGLPMRALEIVLTLLLVLVVVLGLQTVGVVLMIATLVTPAAAARQWTDRLGAMLAIAAAIGAGSAAVGALASATVARLPTGPAIVLVASAALVVSLIAAPRRGLLRAALAERGARRRIREENLLGDLWRLGELRGAPGAPVTLPEVMGMRGASAAALRSVAGALARRGELARGDGTLSLTPSGVRRAGAVVRKHRLWESYLQRRLELPADHLHRDAETMEHALSDEAVETIDRLLGYPAADPHGRPIPRPAGAAERGA
ncbi:MAG: metal ABC transporter permease, partial [Thermoanaerobaculia bacterium]|nr:metal ABC transporter permease [Thermoanaerobaculia bacterium]